MGKVTEWDRDVFERARPITNTSNDGYKILYDSLLQAKNDCTGFSKSDLLRKDAKYYGDTAGTYAIATVPQSIAALQSDPKEFGNAIADFIKKKDLKAFLIATAFEDKDGFHRQLIITAPPKLHDKIIHFLEMNKESKLERLPPDHPIHVDIHNPLSSSYWIIGNDFSRKTL